jgi:hypothetical protein
VPDKSQVQHNYVLFPRGSYLPSRDPASSPEPIVFTIPAGAPKPGSIGGPNAGAASAVSDTYTTLFNWAITKCLGAAANNVHIVAADPAKFHSVIRQAHRPNEQAVHVKGFRGSKDGYLFFLENGILWGFKKPLMFLPLSSIAAISYTSILQRTFNMVVEVFTGGPDDETDEIEFAMLDQEDYPGINETYVMRHSLQDRSMADQRKAKTELAENAKARKPGDPEGDTAQTDAATELEQARNELEQQLLEDEEEDEEDYDPGSEGDSEGDGTSDDDDDDDDDDDEDDDE